MWKKWFAKKNNFVSADYSRIKSGKIPRHIAIIMDGNGRWANKRGLLRAVGHRYGVEALRDIVSTASEIGVGVLTVYAFSTENWKRPTEEVDLLMLLFAEYLDNEIEELHNNNVQVRFIGDISALPNSLQKKIEGAFKKTKDNSGLILNVAVNYGGRAEIVRAVKEIAQKVLANELSVNAINDETIQNLLYTGDNPDPDILIRPSGDQRISNFLLWQSAYTEFWFTDVNWPDFKPDHLLQAIIDFQKRERRFGGLNNSK